MDDNRLSEFSNALLIITLQLRLDDNSNRNSHEKRTIYKCSMARAVQKTAYEI